MMKKRKKKEKVAEVAKHLIKIRDTTQVIRRKQEVYKNLFIKNERLALIFDPENLPFLGKFSLHLARWLNQVKHLAQDQNVLPKYMRVQSMLGSLFQAGESPALAAHSFISRALR